MHNQSQFRILMQSIESSELAFKLYRFVPPQKKLIVFANKPHVKVLT